MYHITHNPRAARVFTFITMYESFIEPEINGQFEYCYTCDTHTPRDSNGRCAYCHT